MAVTGVLDMYPIVPFISKCWERQANYFESKRLISIGVRKYIMRDLMEYMEDKRAIQGVGFPSSRKHQRAKPYLNIYPFAGSVTQSSWDAI